MRFRWAFLQLLLGLALGCANPQPTLLAVQPPQAYSDGDTRLTLLGHDFVPAAILDPLSGRRIATSDGFAARMGAAGQWVELGNLDWLSTGALAVSLPSATAQYLPAAPLDVEVTDPRAHVATLSAGFLELGPDLTRPRLAFASPSPDAPFAPGMLLRGSFHAAKSPPGTIATAGWTAYENGSAHASARCFVAPSSAEVDCGFQFTISQTLGEGDGVRVVADATDASASANRAEASLVISLRAKPSILSLSPASGGTAGGTDILILGNGFLAGSRAMVDGDLLFPSGGIIVDEHTISGHTPAHDAGGGMIAVHTPLGDANGSREFIYLPPPLLAAITPESGTAAGGTAVAITGANFGAGTRIYFGPTLDSAAPLAEQFVQGDTSIVGRTPSGSGPTTVWAFDATLGFTKLVGGFTWRTP
jgi:hypothetical protein